MCQPIGLTLSNPILTTMTKMAKIKNGRHSGQSSSPQLSFLWPSSPWNTRRRAFPRTISSQLSPSLLWFSVWLAWMQIMVQLASTQSSPASISRSSRANFLLMIMTISLSTFGSTCSLLYLVALSVESSSWSTRHAARTRIQRTRLSLTLIEGQTPRLNIPLTIDLYWNQLTFNSIQLKKFKHFYFFTL